MSERPMAVETSDERAVLLGAGLGQEPTGIAPAHQPTRTDEQAPVQPLLHTHQSILIPHRGRAAIVRVRRFD